MKYEYYCKKCSREKEVEHRISEEPIILCRKCNEVMYKLISCPEIIFKGNNWADKLIRANKKGS